MRLAQSKASELQKNLTTTLSLPFQPVAMSHCVSVPALESAPNWKRERTEREQEEEGGGVSHVQNHHPTLSFPSMPDDDFTELTWKNGNPTVHGLGGFIRSTHTKPVPNLNWAETGGTLESVIHQATRHCREPNIQLPDAHESGQNPAIVYSVVGSTGVINTETDSFTDYSGRTLANPTGFEPVKKGTWSRNGLPLPFKELACKKTNQTESVSGSATIGREAETTLTTWVSFESPASTRTKSADKADCTSNRKRQPETDVEDDSACGGRKRNKEAPHKGEGGRSLSTKRSRAAAVHNQLERKRRDRINQKIRALQKLVPNSSKTDKASMLDEVIQYLKQLQAQLQLMSLKNMPHMMMPLGLQQQLMMPYMTPMSMGMGLGMGIGTMDLSTGGSHAIPPLLYPTATTTAAPAFVPLPLASPLMPTHATTHADPNPKPNLAASMPTTCPEFLTQSMNLDHYRKMVALYHQLYQCLPATASVPVSCNPKEVTLNSSTKG